MILVGNTDYGQRLFSFSINIHTLELKILMSEGDFKRYASLHNQVEQKKIESIKGQLTVTFDDDEYNMVYGTVRAIPYRKP